MPGCAHISIQFKAPGLSLHLHSDVYYVLQQRNLKQKFIALLKRFRVSEELEHDQEEIGQKLSGIYTIERN